MEFAVLMAPLGLAGGFSLPPPAKLGVKAETRRTLGAFGMVPAWAVSPLAFALPVVEMTVAAVLVPPTTARPAAVAALILLVLFSAAIAVSLLRGRAPECRCFGRLSYGRVGWGTLGRNAVPATLAAVTILALPSPGLEALAILDDARGVAWMAVMLST